MVNDLRYRTRIHNAQRKGTRRFISIALLVSVALVLLPRMVQAQPVPALSDRAASRLLDQAAFGPNPSSIAAVQSAGIQSWLNNQYTLKVSDIPDQPILDSTGKANRDLTPVQAAFFQNAVNNPDQLRQRVALALSEIFVISALEVHSASAFPPYWRLFRDNAFGNYRDLLKAITLNPGMGAYLNLANNNKADPAKGNAANENYARELLQLFTLGLNQLNPDGSLVLDSNHLPVPTYTQAEIGDMAKLLTGWTYATAPGATAKPNNPAYYLAPMIAVESHHDTSQKTIFRSIVIPAGQTAEQDLDSLLNALMAQPTMSPFVSEQLIQHLVTSNPSPAYIQRVSSVFSNDGTGVAGNLKAVVNAILTDPEARANDDPNAAVSASFGHLREPVLFMANIARGLNATLGPSTKFNAQTNSIGQDLFNAQSVFSYFSPQYRTASGLLGPEFQIYSTATAATRADIVNGIIYGTLDKSTRVNLKPFQQYSSNPGALADYLSYVFLHHAMSNNLRQQIVTAARASNNAVTIANTALYITLTSGEYQIIH